MIADVSLRILKPPLTPEQLRPLDERCRTVQFFAPFSDDEHQAIADFVRQYPRVCLRVFGGWEHPIGTLEFLKHYQGIRSLAVDVYRLQSTKGLELLADTVEALFLGPVHAPLLPRGTLLRFRKLRQLLISQDARLVSEAVKLPDLRVLSLNAVPKIDIGTLGQIPTLQGLAIGLGSVNDANLLAKLTTLVRLDLWRVKGIETADFLPSMSRLNHISMQDLPGIGCLPSLARLDRLHRIMIQGMKSLGDICGAADSPSLRELLVFASPKLTPDSFKPFIGHPSLTHASVALGSAKKNSAIKELLPLPEPDRFGKGIFEEYPD
jgi:hypothetical protein